MRNVFTSKNFRLVFFGALVSELGAMLYSFAVSFYILEITDNNAFLQGLYLFLCGAMLLLSTPVGGVLGDRFNRAKIMFLCDYAKGALILLATALMLLLPDRRAHLVLLFVVGTLGNVIGGIFSPASGALLPEIVAVDQLQQANAYFSVKSAFQSILGIILAGVLYAVLPVPVLFLLVGVCYVLSGVSEMFIRYAYVPRAEKLSLRLALNDLGGGLRYLQSQRPILALMIAILFINFFLSPIWSNFLPYFIRTDVASAPSYLFDGLLKPELWTSVFSMLMGVSSLIGSLILSARPLETQVGRRTALRLCAFAVLILGFSVSYFLLVARGVSLNAFLLLFAFGSFVIGFLLTAINIPVNTLLMQIVDKNQLSKVTSILNVLSQGLTPIASVLAGLVLQGLGSAPLLFLCAAGFAAAALSLLGNKQVRTI